MFEMGFVVGLGLIITMAKVNWKWKMRIASNPVTMDVIIFVLLLCLHWGTFSGVMVATIGALVCSLTISMFRKVYGYMENGRYVRGAVDVGHKFQSVAA